MMTTSMRHALRPICGLLLVSLARFSVADEANPAGYTRLERTTPKIIAAATEFPGGSYSADNLLKPPAPSGYRAEYASHGLADKTYVDFDLGQPQPVAAFRHIQRRTPDTIAEAELIFSDTADFQHELARIQVKHVDEQGATTFASFPPVTARFVRWQVTSVLPGRSTNVGGQGIDILVAAGAPEAKPSGLKVACSTLPILRRGESGLRHPLYMTIDYPYAETLQAVARLDGQEPRPFELHNGAQELQFEIPASDQVRELAIGIEVADKSIASPKVSIKPVKKLTIYVLPHSHTDIGYTAIQTDIEEKQINNLLQGLADARRTADYPPGARFVWNVEVTWAAELFLQRLPVKYRDEFLDAIRRGQISLNGMYLNELTGLCRPEELLRLFRYSTQLAEQTGVPVDSAMISDVPGYTWGTVTAMQHAGVKYFSVAPNYFDRIGDILVQWENKPFWWIGPDGTSRVLVWIPFRGYATSHIYRKMSPEFVTDLCRGLESRSYPYEIAYLRWAGLGDNAVPDASICDFVKDWNAEHESPQFVISSTSEAFRAFEQRHGDQLPQVRGDWTPYWEDGAGSSAAETAMNRTSSERLAQAETLWALLDPPSYPAARFAAAWNAVLLYSEHTWGAHCSISRPTVPFTMDQWVIKQSYATNANLLTRQLLSEAAQRGSGFEPMPVGSSHVDGNATTRVDIYNTTAWPRTGVVLLPRELSDAGNFVQDEQGEAVPAQRLVSDELAVLVQDIPPLSGRRYVVTSQGPATVDDTVKVELDSLGNDLVQVRIDPKTGSITELRKAGLDVNLVDASSGHAINDYLYLLGDDVTKLQRSGPPTITIRDRGPLVGSLLIESDAPGCHKLSREIRVVVGSDHVELLNTVDKKRLENANYYSNEGKESINFAFPFHVPNGEIRLDVPWGVVRPELDQIPSACKNWLTVGRWAEVANQDYGVTWVTLDAPLVQVGGITANLLNSQTNPAVWRKKIEPTQQLYTWAMNNHWGTNYRAFQEGPVMFRFVVRPHVGAGSPAEATRFATNFSQPLLAVPGRGAVPDGTPLLTVEPSEVVVSSVKPSDDGKALIVRLFAADAQEQVARISWPRHAPTRVWLSDTSELPKQPVTGDVTVPAWGVVTLRAELSE